MNEHAMSFAVCVGVYRKNDTFLNVAASLALTSFRKLLEHFLLDVNLKGHLDCHSCFTVTMLNVFVLIYMCSVV